jgi:hypothetical protein
MIHEIDGMTVTKYTDVSHGNHPENAGGYVKEKIAFIIEIFFRSVVSAYLFLDRIKDLLLSELPFIKSGSEVHFINSVGDVERAIFSLFINIAF